MSTGVSSPPAPRGSHRSFLLLILVPILVSRVAFVVTYPLNIAEDGASYYSGLLNGNCSLMHAPGYNFLMGIPLRIPSIKALAAEHPLLTSYVLLTAQHVIDVATLLVLLHTLCSLFNRVTAGLCALCYSVNVFGLGVTSTCRPEWLQGDLLTLALCSAYYAFRAEETRRKFFLYGVSSTCMTWCVLVKPNAMIMAPLYAGLFLAESASLRQKVIGFSGAGLCAVLNVGAFLGLYHYPATGTLHLTYDKAFLFMSKINIDRTLQPLDPNNGIHTKRWLALNSVLPPEYDFPDRWLGFRHEHAVPAEVRRPFREQYLSIMRAGHETLDELLLRQALPKEFKLYYSFLPIQYYVGQKESESLAEKVFLEAVWAHRGAFCRSVLRSTWAALKGFRGYELCVNIPVLPDLAAYGVAEREPRALGFVEYDLLDPKLSKTNPYSYPYRPVDETLWHPGIVVFSWLWNKLPAANGVGACRLIALTVVLAAAGLVVGKGAKAQCVCVVALAALLVPFIVLSYSLYSYRVQEFRAVLPIYCVLAAVGMSWLGSAAWLAIQRFAELRRLSRNA